MFNIGISIITFSFPLILLAILNSSMLAKFWTNFCQNSNSHNGIMIL